MSANIIAKRYATALFEAATASSADVAAMVGELRTWSDWLSEDNDGAKALLSPVLKPDQQAAFLDKLIEGSDTSAIVAGFLRVALSKRRLNVLELMLTVLEDLIDAQDGTIRGTATTAYTIDDSLKTEIINKLAEITNKKPALAWQEDESLLGGFRIQIDQTVWDASLKKQLTQLGNTIRKGVQ